jgi:adenosylhomocysteinase
MSRPSRAVRTEFVGTAAEAEAMLMDVLRRLESRVVVLGGDNAIVDLQVGEGTVHIGAGPVADDLDAKAGTYEVTAMRRSEVTTADWAGVVDVVRRLPFTETEREKLDRTMPLTSGLPTSIRGDPLAGLAALMTIHHMRDFDVMVRKAIDLGLDPADITVIDKEYRYEFRHRVDESLVQLGLTVERYSDIVAAIGRHLDRASRKGLRTIVLDDGGYVGPVLFDHYGDRLQGVVGLILGLIEQTVSGIWKLRPYETLPVPVFSVAESRLKKTIEAYGVTDSGFRNVQRLLRDEMFEGRGAVVIGLGRLGPELVKLLRERHLRVTAYDQDALPALEAEKCGVDVATSLVEALSSVKPIVIFGCSGAALGPAMTAEHFEALKRDCYLVSFTSRNDEFDVVGLASLAAHSESRGRVGTAYRLPSGVEVTLVADGYPANFHYAESMPNRSSDLILASMLVGACTLASDPRDFVPGHNVGATDRALEASGIIAAYQRLYQ